MFLFLRRRIDGMFGLPALGVDVKSASFLGYDIDSTLLGSVYGSKRLL